MIKSANLDKVIFIDDHLYYEELVEAITNEVIEKGFNKGTVYIHLLGKNCTTRLKGNIINLLMSVDKIFIFDKEENWMIGDPKIHYTNPEKIFANNHQRFFIYQGPGYNVALVSRRNQDQHEGAMANSDEAVSLLAQIVGLNVYKN